MAWKWLKNRVSDLADAAWDAATEVADAVVDGVGSAAAATGDVIGTVGAVVDTATFGAASGILDVVDNTVLDTVDTLTGGLVDVDFDDGNLSAAVGIEGVAHVGAKVGEDGLAHSADLLDQKYDISASDDGLSTSAQAGVDWGPLPYSEYDLKVGADGDITFDGRVQGTLPTPFGLASGRAEAHVVRDEEMWGASLDAEGTLRRPDGSIVAAGVDVAYVDTPDGSALSVGVEGSYTVPGVGSVGGSLGYDRIEADGIVAERFEADAHASGYGLRVDAGVEHTSITDAGGTTSTWDVNGDIDVGALAPAPEPAPEPNEPPPTEFETAIAAADDVQSGVDEMFAELG